jgi:hypothetical protein
MDSVQKRRVVFWVPAGIALIGVLFWLLRPQAVAVDL